MNVRDGDCWRPIPKNPGPGTVPETIWQRVVALAGERYRGINHTQLTGLLAEREGVIFSRPTVKRLLVRAGPSDPRRRPCHRYRSQRMPQEGILLHLDGSHHAWLEDRGPWLTLLLAADDATGTAPHSLSQEQEDTLGYFSLLQGIIERRGGPMAVYTDRHAVFRAAARDGSICPEWPAVPEGALWFVFSLCSILTFDLASPVPVLMRSRPSIML